MRVESQLNQLNQVKQAKQVKARRATSGMPRCVHSSVPGAPD
jgi:hypothetical protein